MPPAKRSIKTNRFQRVRRFTQNQAGVFEGGNIHDPTKTEQLDTVVTPSDRAKGGAQNVSMDYSDLHDKFLVLYFRFQGMNVSEGLGRRQPMRMTRR